MTEPPTTQPSKQHTMTTVAVMLVGAALCFTVSPLLVGRGYVWWEQSISESAAQGIAWGWVTRVGFVLLGGAVMLLAAARPLRWGLLGPLSHGVCAAALIAAVVFSRRPWADVAFDETQDTLHSVAASVAGIGIVTGIAAVAIHTRRTSGQVHRFDVVALAGVMLLPAAMVIAGGVAGLAQRLMFAVAIAWYGTEATRLNHEPSGRTLSGADQSNTVVADATRAREGP